MGGRIGYSLVTGIVVAIVCVTGLVGTFLAIFPMQALVPVLLYIGLVIGSQANTASAKRYAPAIVLALLPSLAQWATGQIDNALAAAALAGAAIVAVFVESKQRATPRAEAFEAEVALEAAA